MEGTIRTTELVPALEGSALELSLLELDGSELMIGETDRDVLLLVREGPGSLTLADERFDLERGSAALVLADEQATVSAGENGIAFLRATAGPGTDRHAALGPRETVVSLDGSGAESATGSRSFQVLFGPSNGSTRATLFVGYLPPGRAPWHYHLYDEIVWVPKGPGRLHLEGSETPLEAGSAFRLRPRQVHIVENASADRELAVVGIFTPAGSPSAAYLPR